MRRATELGNLRDREAALALFHPDLRWQVAREHPETRTIVGRDAVADYHSSWQETMPDMRFDIEQLTSVADSVLATGTIRGTGSGSGADVAVPLAVVFTVKDGLIVAAEEYLDAEEALLAIGLSP